MYGCIPVAAKFLRFFIFKLGTALQHICCVRLGGHTIKQHHNLMTCYPPFRNACRMLNRSTPFRIVVNLSIVGHLILRRGKSGYVVDGKQREIIGTQTGGTTRRLLRTPYFVPGRRSFEGSERQRLSLGSLSHSILRCQASESYRSTCFIWAFIPLFLWV